MCKPSVIEEVFAEMQRARELHGESYMGSLRRIHEDDWTLNKAIEAGEAAKERLENSDSPARFDVLLEEVGELARDLANGYEAHDELVQVAAMALAWLGAEPVAPDA
ncbi:MAG: hypothetical protein ACYCXZ_06700 [Coriobacteriia bacterium]